jgi:predicted TIM-barrel fold metal-dependent hydrolase
VEAKMKPENVQNIIDHLGHVDYPVTGKKFSEACDNMSDVSEEEKKWVKNNIDMDKKYMSAQEIKKALKL